MTSDQPDWETYPNLDGVITKSDVALKAPASFPLPTSTTEVSQLLRQYAPGWQLNCSPPPTTTTKPSSFVNDSGIVKGFFQGPTGSGLWTPRRCRRRS